MDAPNINVGPILRRIDNTLASVWIACRQSYHCILQIYKGDKVKVKKSYGVPSLPWRRSCSRLTAMKHLKYNSVKINRSLLSRLNWQHLVWYADDVTGMLLPYGVTQEVTERGGEEKVQIRLDNSSPIEEISTAPAMIPVCLREHIIQEYAGFARDSGSCHWIGFEELLVIIVITGASGPGTQLTPRR